MQRIILSVIILFCLFSCSLDDRDFADIENPIDNKEYKLVHYWNFNNKNTLDVPTSTEGGASLEYAGSRFDDVEPGSEINSRNGDETGYGLRLRNPSGELIINVPSTGYKDVILSYAATRTGSGSQTQTISYTTDGKNYTQTGLSQTDYTLLEDTYVIIQLNFSGIEATDNNPNFKVKVEFDNASSQIENGNNRIDNLTLDGIPTGGTNPEPGNAQIFHYWNFNNLEKGDNPSITPNIGTGALEYLGNYYDRVDPGSNVNAQNNDEAGYALRLRNQSDALVMTVPTSGYEKVVLKYAATRTGNGSKTQTIYYTLNGRDYIQTGLTQTVFDITEDDIVYSLYQVDFSSILEINNNPNFKIKVVFDEASATADSGNNRIDNISLEGEPTKDPIPEPELGPFEVFHYWNFNDLKKGDNPEIIPNIGTGTLEYFGNYYDRVDPGSNLNAQNNDEAGYALRLRNQSGAFIMTVPTTHHTNIVLKYAATRTGSGSQTHTISYTTDGTNYIQTGLSQTVFNITEDDTVFSQYEIDFSSISGASNNPDFKIKMEFDDASATADSGNNRIDNITIEGNTL